MRLAVTAAAKQSAADTARRAFSARIDPDGIAAGRMRVRGVARMPPGSVILTAHGITRLR
jgi:hypothetical protein